MDPESVTPEIKKRDLLDQVADFVTAGLLAKDTIATADVDRVVDQAKARFADEFVALWGNPDPRDDIGALAIAASEAIILVAKRRGAPLVVTD